MKRIQISLFALLFSVSVSSAQPREMHKHSASPDKEVAFKNLNLTEDQKVKIKAVNEDFKKQMQTVKSNENQTVKQQRDAQEALTRQYKLQVENILTAEQKTQWQQTQKGGKLGQGEMLANRMDKMKTELNLTDNQLSQIKTSQQDLKNKMDAINNNASLDRTTKMQQLHALREEQKKSIEQVLTPEQKEKWQGLMKNHPHQNRSRKGDHKDPQAQV